jgi:hypothetical protein
LALALLGAILLFVFVVGRHDPPRDWLLFHYLRAGLLAALFALSCLVAGHACLVRVLGRTLPFEEHVTVAFALGVLSFFLTSLGFGLVGLYGWPFFFGCPALLLSFGARRFAHSWHRARRHLASARPRFRWSLETTVALACGAVGIALVWFPILTPDNASYDARWYHLSIAQHYLAEGRISPFKEGWIPGALPQLASLIYAWPLSGPGVLFDRVEAAAHCELVVFLFTLLGVTALVRRMLGTRSPAALGAVFLFPGIFCYDSGLVLGADHVAALWAAPIALLSWRYFEAPSRPFAVLLGAVIAGAIDTKYTAVNLVPLPLALVGARALLDWRTRASRSLAALSLVVAGAVGLFTAPHWLKNLFFYGDPLFPLLRRWLPSHPWTPSAEAPYAAWFALNRPPFGWSGLGEMLRTLATFSFSPHDYPQYHQDVPIFGSLFTLCTPCLLFLARKRRILWLFGGVYLGLCAWFWIHAIDRYLQALLPWMAAGTAGVLTLLWREGGLVRGLACGLVGLQVAWGGDVPFIPAHQAAGAAIPKVVVDLLGRRYRHDAPLVSYPDWEAMGRALPRSAKVLVHEEMIHFGLETATALDAAGYQGALYWGEPGAASPAEIWRQLRAQHVTHLLWATNLDHATDTVAAGLSFFDFALHHTRRLGIYGGFSLSALGDTPPPETPPATVAYYPCPSNGGFAPGRYDLRALSADPRRTPPPASEALAEALPQAQFLVLDARCHPPLREATRARFELLAARGTAMLMQRKPGR